MPGPVEFYGRDVIVVYKIHVHETVLILINLFSCTKNQYLT